VREKTSEICIYHSDIENKTSREKLSDILMNMKLTEKSKEVKKTLDNPSFILRTKETLKKSWKKRELDQE
jgi:hypothetical protein